MCGAYFAPSMAGVDSPDLTEAVQSLAEAIQSLVSAFVESCLRPGTLDFPADRPSVS